MIKASAVTMVKNIGIHAIYPISLIVMYRCVFPPRILFSTGHLAQNGSFPHSMPTFTIVPIEKGPPVFPHLLYLCNLCNDRNIQYCTVLCHNCHGEFRSIEDWKEVIPEKEFMRSFQVALLHVLRCSNRLALQCNDIMVQLHYDCISTELMIASNKK